MAIVHRNLGTRSAREVTIGGVDRIVGVSITLADSDLAGEFGPAELEAAFSKVHPPGDWKGEIDALIKRTDQDLVAAAIEHYTATEPTFECAGDDFLRVTAIGYRMGPAGP